MSLTSSAAAERQSYFTRGLHILGLRYGLASNNANLILNPEFYEPGEIQSQITNYCDFDFIPYTGEMDAYLTFVDVPGRHPEVLVRERDVVALGDWGRLDTEKHDRRYTLMGNMGLFFRFCLATQERHGIYSLHASAVYRPDRDELMVIVGKSGAGKTVYLLEGILRGWQIFSTEMTYFRLTPGGVVFYRGALLDNIRVGNFVYDYPQAAEILGLKLPDVEDPWEAKISVPMGRVTTESAELWNPRLTFLFPRIESGREGAVVTEVKRPLGLIKALFDSAAEKIGGTFLLYEEVPVPGLDTPELVNARLEAMRKLVEAPKWQIVQAKNILAGSKSCMEGID
ncbi:MAG: hypothetical protein ACUVXG_03990 [Anaerolineae bacterium]|mgnify:CR=1 FL=1